MYPGNSRFSIMNDDFEDDFYERFDVYDDSYYDDDASDNVRASANYYDGILYSSDYDYGISNIDDSDVVSFTECTGMVRRGTAEADELSEFREMYNFGATEDDR
ncbi:MAG: hypothetical protein IJB96_07410 [Lachnospira sp.]|nr:hypothetical protein [Lachnospira sp.]